MSDSKNDLTTRIYEKYISAYNLILVGESNDDETVYKDAILNLDHIVNDILDEFYFSSLTQFTEEERAILDQNIKNQERSYFEKLSLGHKMAFFRSEVSDGLDFIQQVEFKKKCDLDKLKEFRDGNFVTIRNSALKQRKIISKDIAIENFDLVVVVLTELGYENFYNYKTLKYNNFVEKIKSLQDIFLIDQADKPEIKPGILSNFTCASTEINAIDELQNCENLLIIGEGGIGKSTFIRHFYDQCINKNKSLEKKTSLDYFDSFSPIPILIPGTRIDKPTTRDNVLFNFLSNINKLYEEINLKSEIKDLENLYGSEEHNPFFIVIIDGFNEIGDLSHGESEIFHFIFEELIKFKIQVLITSRRDPFPSNKDNVFKKVHAEGLSSEQINQYIENQHKSSLNKNPHMLDIFKNPMLLLLYTEYLDKESFLSQDQSFGTLVSENKLKPISNNNCKSSILWNFVQYNILYDKIYYPVFNGSRTNEVITEDKIKLHNTHAKIVCELLPKIAWFMVLDKRFQVEYSEIFEQEDIIKFVEALNKEAGTRGSNYKPIEDEKAVNYLIEVACLLELRDGNVNFVHQNYRDFFAACYYIRGYKPLHGDNSDNSLYEQLKDEFPSDIKIYVGELLTKVDTPDHLKEILENYLKNPSSKTENKVDKTVENIFEIYKASDTLNLKAFIKADFKQLYLGDVPIDQIIAFLEGVLEDISVDDILSEKIFEIIYEIIFKKIFKKPEKLGTSDRLLSLFMISVRYSSNLNGENIEKFVMTWHNWAKEIYNNKTKTPSKSPLAKLAYLTLSNRTLSNYVFTKVIYSLLIYGNLGIGKKDVIGVFQEVSDFKPQYISLMAILKQKGQDVSIDNILNPMYTLASRNDYAASFVCFLLNYYLFHNMDDGLTLIKKIQKKMEMDNASSDEKTLLTFRMISGMNYCVQELLYHNRNKKRELQGLFKEKIKPYMNEILEQELNNFSPEISEKYKKFEYGYYFPFGNQFSFDNSIDENTTMTKILNRFFPEDGSAIDELLFKKVVLDIAVVSTSTFFMQDELYNSKEKDEFYEGKYLGNTFKFFETITFNIYPNDLSDSKYDDSIKQSVIEALAIIYLNYPLKTEKFIDRLVAKYYNANRHGKIDHDTGIFSLKDSVKAATKEKFKHLCHPKLRGEELTIEKFLENYKNILVFADFANNLFISYPDVTESLVVWGETSFYKNIDDYAKDPEKFVKVSLEEIASKLEE